MIEWQKAAIDVGIVVVDYEAQHAFYQDVLGLKHLGDIPLPPVGSVHVYECGDTLLKLYELPSAQPRPTVQFGTVTGLAYLTLNVADIELVVREIENRGGKLLAPVSDFSVAEPLLPPAGEIRARVCMIADAEGNVIELLQRY